MPTILSELELRVLGALIEKQVTTPEYYPLTLNALTLACNQKNNRYPITAYDDATVAKGLEALREKNLSYVFYGSSSRVPKYKHVMTEIFHLSQPELALMCVLMLRGPQTVGELHTRAARLWSFTGLEEVDETLGLLARKEPDPLVLRLPRQPGQKEARIAHLLAGEIDLEQMAEAARAETTNVTRPQSDRVQRLEQEVGALRAAVTSLQEQFEEFKKQFD